MVVPQSLEAVGADSLVAVQFLRGGAVRLAFNDAALCDQCFEHGLVYQGIPLRIVRAEANVRSVFLRDLPLEAADDVVSAFFASFGKVLSVVRTKYAGVPYFVRIGNHDWRVWYSRQPPHCSICLLSPFWSRRLKS